MSGAWTVPFFANQRENREHQELYLSAFREVLEHGLALQGPEVAAFEAALAAKCGRAYAVAVGSATDALYFSMRAAGIGLGDEVLVTAFSFVASASSITRTGATPVFVDVEPSTLQMSFADLRERVTPRTRAIVAVHLYGQMLDPRELQSVADEFGLLIVEDAAQALGASFDGIPAGSLGLASAISFDPTKVLSAPGSGGAVLTDSAALRDEVVSLRYHGKSPNGDFSSLGYNSQMPSVTAGMLRRKLDLLEEFQDARQTVAACYNEAFSDLEVQLLRAAPQSDHIYHKYVLRLPDGVSRLCAGLADAGVEYKVHYPRALPFEPLFSNLGNTREMFPVASTLEGTLVSLPVHPFLTSDEVRRVIDCVQSSVPATRAAAR